MNIKQISPIAASLKGGATITIEGTKLEEEAEVYFGSVKATNISLNKEGNLTATLPEVSETGIVSITVINPDGTNTELTNGFTYINQTTENTEIFGISPLAIFENTPTEIVLRGRHLIECYNNGVFALKGPAGTSISASNITTDDIDTNGTEELRMTVTINPNQSIAPEERLAIQILASRRPEAAVDGIVETSKNMFTVLPENIPVPMAFTAEVKADKPTPIVILGRNLTDCTLDFGSNAILHTEKNSDNLVSGIVTVSSSSFGQGGVSFTLKDAGGNQVGQYELVESDTSNLAPDEVTMSFTPVPGQRYAAPGEDDETVYHLNGQTSSLLPYNWGNFEFVIFDETIILPIINEVNLIPFFDGGDEYESPVLAEVGKLFQLRGMGLLIAAKVEVTIRIRVVLIIGFVFDIFPFGIHNEFSQYPYALGSVVIDVRFELDIIIIISFMLALVEPSGNLRVLLQAGLRIGIDFDLTNNNSELIFDPEFRHFASNNGVAPDGNLSPCGGNFILASDQGETSFVDSFGGYRSYYLPKVANQECCLTWNFDMQLSRFRPGETPEIIEDSFNASYCLQASPNQNQYRIYITSEPAPTGIPETLEMNLSDTAQLYVMAEPVDSNGNSTGPAVNIEDLDYGVEFFLDDLIDVLDPTTLPEGDAFAVQTGDNLIKAAVTSVEILDDEEVIAFYPDSISGFSIMEFLARGEAPRVVPEGLPVSVETVAANANITVSPKLAYLDGNNIVDASSKLLRNEPFETQREYFLAVEFDGIDINTPSQNIKFTANFNSISPKIKVTKVINSSTVSVQEPPLKLSTQAGSNISLPFRDQQRSDEDLPNKFFDGDMLNLNEELSFPIDSNTPNNQLLKFPGSNQMDIKPYNKEIGNNSIITSLVPPGFNVGGRHVEIHVSVKVESDNANTSVVTASPLLKLRVENEETFEEYLRVFHETETILSNTKLINTKIENFGKRFFDELKNSLQPASPPIPPPANQPPSNSLLIGEGQDLWSKSVEFVQSGVSSDLDKIDDRILYYFRLQCLAGLRNHYKRNNLGAVPSEKINMFEWSSRGLKTTDGINAEIVIGTDDKRKAIVTGFDPFFLPSNPPENNSSGLSAIGLHKKTYTPSGSDSYEVRSAVFPVRFKDFNEGLIENFTGSSIAPVVMLMTTSLHGDQIFDVERFAGKRRTKDVVDNLNVKSITNNSNLVGEEYLESTLPHTKVITVDPVTQSLPLPGGGSVPFVLDQEYLIQNYVQTLQTILITNPNPPNVPGKYRKRSQPTTEEAWNKKETPDINEPLNEASGGNYLSNEIMYRTALKRSVQKPELASGHLHVPPANPKSSEGKNMVLRVQNVVEKFMKHLYLISAPEDVQFLDTVTNTSRTLDIALTNPKGNGTINIASVELVTPGPFTINLPQTPFTIGDNQAKTIPFEFMPTTTGLFETDVKFKDATGQVLAKTKIAGTGVITLPIPAISSFSPPSGRPFTSITVTGINFRNVSQVLMGGQSTFLFSVVSDTEIRIFATNSGKIKVITAYGEAESVGSFNITGRTP